MPDYQKMYTTLFNAVTDALEHMARSNYGAAQDRLIRAQQETEELYLCQEESAVEGVVEKLDDMADKLSDKLEGFFDEK